MTRHLVLTPRAKAQINDLYEHVAREGSLEIADRYIESLLERIAGLIRFPNRGTSRDDLRPGLRTVADASPSPMRSSPGKCGSSQSPGRDRK